MKIVKVYIRRGGVGENQLCYPASYNAEQVDREGFGPTAMFGTSSYSGGVGRGENHEYCLIVLEDALAETYAVDKDMEIIDPSEADTLMEQWRIDNHESEEVVDDPERLQAIASMVTANIPLSAEDLKAMDVEDPTVPGRRKRLRPFAQEFARRAKDKTLRDKFDQIIDAEV